jgi:hypothetical protein|tara:strand:+ start:838 stop:1302 length:465 start_codon:yes stop_codon:yes gene_type:complete
MIDTDKYEGHDYSWYVKYHKSTGKHEVRVEGKNEVEDDFVCYLQYHPAFKDEQAKNAKLIADAPLLLAEVKRLREALVGDSEDWTTDELVEKALTLYDKALVFDAIYDWHTRMQLQGEGIEYNLDRMDWLLKNPTKEYEDYDVARICDKEYDEE